MLYALILAGLVFLFVTFWHFVFERLFSPAGELEYYTKWRIDIYVSFFLSLFIVSLLLHSGAFLDAYLAFANAYLVLFVVIFVLILYLWKTIADFLQSKWPWLKVFLGKVFLGKVLLYLLEGFRGKVLLDLFVGLAMVLMFSLWFHKYTFLSAPEDASMDFAMRVNKCEEDGVCDFPGKDENQIPPKIVLLNIDDKTYDEWGKPLVTPRDRLKGLIEKAANDGARLILVDIFLDDKTAANCNDVPCDKVLKDYLANYDSQKECGGHKCPPIILIRRSFDDTKTGFFAVSKPPVRQMSSDFLGEKNAERWISSPTSLIQWTLPYFWVSEFDGRLRRWWLWQPVCENGKPKFIPTPQLLVASLISRKDKNYEVALKQLEEISTTRIDPDFVGKDSCPPDYGEPKELTDPIVLNDNFKINVGELSGGVINQRIMFIMPWVKEPSLSKRVSVSAKFDPVKGKQEIFTVYPVHLYLTSGFSPDPEITDSVVIIGNTHSNANDTHNTPLGNMPGMLVVANGIYSLFLNGGQIESPFWAKMAAESILLLVTALIINVASYFPQATNRGRRLKFLDWWHERLGYWPAMFVVTVIIMGPCLIHLSSVILRGSTWFYPFREGGTWIDFSLPLVAIFFHHVVTSFHELGKEKEEAIKRETEAKKRIAEAEEKTEKEKKEKLACQEELSKCKQNAQQLSLELQKVKRV